MSTVRGCVPVLSHEKRSPLRAVFPLRSNVSPETQG